MDTKAGGKIKYYAFISYKRADSNPIFEEDEKWANIIYKTLRAWDIPVAIKKEPSNLVRPRDKKIDPVFLDKTRMNGAGNVNSQITTNLSVSKCLVVVCSHRMIEDERDREAKGEKAYVFDEIRDFLSSKNGTIEELKKRVFLVWIDENQLDPSTDIPSLLEGKKVIVVNEYRKDKKEKGKLEERVVSEIAASIFDAHRIVFWDSFLRKKIRRRNIVFSVIGTIVLVLIIMLVALLSSNAQLELSKARRALSEGNRKEALQKSLSAFHLWPCSQGITESLWESFEPSMPFMTFESDVAICKATQEFAVIRDKQYVDIYDFNTLAILHSYDVGHGSVLQFSPNGNKLAVYTKKQLTIIDRDRDSLIRKLPFNISLKGVCFGNDGSYVYCDGLDQAYKLPDLEKSVLAFPSLPYYSFKYDRSGGSFVGTSDRIAFVTKAYDIVDRAPSDTVWTLTVFNLTNPNHEKKLTYAGKEYSRTIADISYDLPDSASFAGVYSDQPVFFFTTPHFVNFMQVDSDTLLNRGTRQFSFPANGWKKSAESVAMEINRRPMRIVAALSNRDENSFILESSNGMKFRLNKKQKIETSSPGFVESETVSFYRGKFLATDDTLNLFSDKTGNLYLKTSAPRDDFGFDHPLKGVHLTDNTQYSIQKYKSFQFVTENYRSASGRVYQSLMYWGKDLREVQLPKDPKGMTVCYRSPDLQYALMTGKDLFGVYDYSTRTLLPVSSSPRYSSDQNHPLYRNGDKIFILAPTANQAIGFDIVEVNLMNRSVNHLFSGLEDVDPLSNGIVIGHIHGKTILYDLNRPGTEEEYQGLYDVKKGKGFYQVYKRIPSPYGSYSSRQDTLIYNSSVRFIKPSLSENAFYWESSSCGNYMLEISYQTRVQWHDTIIYTFRDIPTMSPIVELVGESSSSGSTFFGMSSNDRFFYYEKDGCLAVYDFTTHTETQTTLRVDRDKIGFEAISDRFLFFPGNTFKIVDLSTGRAVMSLPEIGFKWSNDQVAFSPDNKWMLAGENLINLTDRQIVSTTIPWDRNRALTNQHVIYTDKAISLPRKMSLIRQVKDALTQTE